MLGGCASLPPGAHAPKTHSDALTDPGSTNFGKQFTAAHYAPGESGFHLFNVGVDGFLMRMEMINAAERTLDLQYYIFRSDESGQLLTDALLRAADRGVKVRILVDDGETVPGDERLLTFANHTNVQIRVFNPFDYRGHLRALRAIDYLLHKSRLDYRMHNKLLVADNAAALVGGRNVGDQYFQIDPDSQFADDDVFTEGPTVPLLSATFNAFWDSDLAIPAEALHRPEPHPHHGSAKADKLNRAGFDYQARLAAGVPLADIFSGKLPLVHATALVVCDTPEKKQAVKQGTTRSLMYQPVADAISASRTELIVVTPYFIPAPEEMQLLKDSRARDLHVRLLTNSMESAQELSAHSGYMHYRKVLLREGVELHEIRAMLGSTRGSGQSKAISRHGNFGLHAKMFVFDRRRVFIGSMNFDQRSRRLNTEVGVIIDSRELSQQAAERFEAMVKPENAYAVELKSGGKRERLVWHTVKDGQPVDYDSEPVQNAWRKIEAKALTLVPLDSEL